jgi:uncharacterized membrane protein YqiK
VLDFLNINTSVIVVFVAIIIVALLFAYLGSRYKVAGANEALIRSGRATPLGGGEAGSRSSAARGSSSSRCSTRSASSSSPLARST